MTSIKKFLLQHMVFITVISFVCLYCLWVLNEYAEFKEESALIRDIILPLPLIKAKNEGFYSYTWSKPGEKSPEHLKMAYVKYFEPYGWGIGTGDYVEDVETEIQEEVLERISKLRFENEGYFFGSIYGGQPLFTNGKITKGTANVWNLTDPKGVKIIQEQNRAAKAPEGGFVSYSWQKMDSGTLSPKLSYVAGIPEWEWIIGAGVHLDTMDEVIISKKKELYHNFFETASSQATVIDPTELQFEEFRRIAMAANQMIEARTKAVQSLRESEEKYRLMAENMSDVISMMDMNFRFTYVSPSISRLTGFINVYSEPGQGTTFRIYLPRYSAADEIPVVIQPDKPVPGGNETILLMEDEPAILDMTRISSFCSCPATRPMSLPTRECWTKEWHLSRSLFL
jgi:PAS domain-containing protein